MYAYCDDSSTDWSDSSVSSDSEIETEIMTVEKAQTRVKDEILAEAKKEQPFDHHPRINYELLKQFKYVDCPDSFASPPPRTLKTILPQMLKLGRKNMRMPP